MLHQTAAKANSFIESESHQWWWLYIVQTRHNHWYTGVSNDVVKRFEAHQQGKGAKNLRGKGPLSLIFATPVGSRSDACKLEWQVKKMRRATKAHFIASTDNYAAAIVDVLQPDTA
ncbi:GIY-YIG nuclease family protein [Pseudoalteromonas sp. CnMc7-15]|uniref:GIY-YIG nuclease family protein n=1 Tax=unclassified Pseudoalteromonas TaxID=194690 RepID=UPI001EF4AB71|nr:GIY-YIG nuclease family protein [Pseudoalteromonas sp. CnMc7-15]MCG7566904.1 GIY-YIG nuclease family protein [Pseudoalteromonas sp. CnMc7-15]